MRVMGIDPGLAHTGFGVLDVIGGRIKFVSYGVIETKSEESHEIRLLSIYNRLCALIDEFKPDEAEMETLFFSRNSSSALAVAEAKGVITLCFAQNAVPLFTYTPNQIKYSVTGTRDADKETVQNAVKFLLNLRTVPQPNHAADALAGAITHINVCGIRN